MNHLYYPELTKAVNMLERPRPGFTMRRTTKRSEVEHFIKTFRHPKSLPLAKDGIKLTPGEEFSPALSNVIGKTNTTYIHGLEGSLLINVFEAFMEREASFRFKYGNGGDPIVILSKLEDVEYCNLAESEMIRWKLCGYNEVESGWTHFIRIIFNLSRLDAIATLANLLGTSIENIHFPSRSWGQCGQTLTNKPFRNLPPHFDLPFNTYGSIHIEGTDGEDILDHSENVLGAIVKYTLDDLSFCLPATTCNNRLSIGLCQPFACLLSQHLIDRYPASTILFFQDVRSALSMKKLLNSMRDYNQKNVLVTAHLGTDLSLLPWNYLYGHNVVFIPAPTKSSLSMVSLYHTYITGVLAESFQVYPGFLLHSPLGVELETGLLGLSEAENALLSNTVVLDNVQRPLDLVQNVIEKSKSYDEFLLWGHDTGVFKRPKETSSVDSVSVHDALPPADPSETPPPPNKLEEVVLHHFIRPGTSVEVLGAKNAGKTQFALSICAALRRKGALCSIFRNEANVPCNVAYVDAETLPDEFLVNLKQYGLDNDAGFFGLCKFDKETNNIFPTVSLMSQEFREGLRNFLLEKKCRYVVLDNLTALMGNRVDYGDAAQEVIEWMELLQNDGICTIFIHHLGGDYQGKARGSKIFTIRARTIITLTGKNEILRDPDVAESIKTSARQDGLTVGLRFDTCKTGALLEGKVFYAHLPFGASHWEYLGATGADGQQIDFPLGKSFPVAEEAHSIPADGISTEDLHSLSSDELDVVQVLKNRPSKRAQIQEQLGWGEEKTQRTLKALVEKGIVVREGGSRNTSYKLNNGK